MAIHKVVINRIGSLLLIIGILSITGLLLSLNQNEALGATSEPGLGADRTVLLSSPLSQGSSVIHGACPGGPVIDGVTLDECVDNSFSVGGTTKTVRVWYTKNVSTVQRTVDGTVYDLTHYIDNDTQAENVAQWGREAWQRYYQVFGRHPWNVGCGDRINVQLEDGVGWAGIAYWAGDGSCRIGIDSPMIRSGGGQAVVYHEFQHYTQYSFNDGCYTYIRNNYNSGKPSGNAEFVEGYADLAMDTVDAALDLALYEDIVHEYVVSQSFYDKSYNDVFSKYFSEQLGSEFSTADPHWHFDAVREHYEACDVHDTLNVLDTLVPSLQPGLSEEELFLNFFAANWAKDWADPLSQPELVYFDDDTGPDYGDVILYKDVNMSSGVQNWPSETTPDDWAARYYQAKPQSGCKFMSVRVDGAVGAHLGINIMAADTTSPTSVNRIAWIGEDLARTFPAYGTYDRFVAVVNSFDNIANYEVTFSCVTPVVSIQEPGEENFAQVGEPLSPISFLARFSVTYEGSPVLGLAEELFSADAEGDPITIVPGSLSQVSEEYWAIMVPPTKPAGTDYVDLEICLDSTICATENEALLYVDPGNTDFALVFDGSGSMDIEDVLGEGKRYENAQKAGTVLADLLRDGDRILVTDFSAKDNPIGCGLPYGDGNCELDIITRLSRIDVDEPVDDDIEMTIEAINAITPREWTPIGAALQDGMNQLVDTPLNDNPQHLVLLSDGDENVNPLYADVRDELIASGVIVDTIRFSADAPGDLLAQIAADTGGVYRYVPTKTGTMDESAQQMIEQLIQSGFTAEQIAGLIHTAEQSTQEAVDYLSEQGVPATLANQLTAVTLPGPLGLDDVYDYFETEGQGAARLVHVNHVGILFFEWTEPTQIYVDESVDELRIVVASKQPDIEMNCSPSERDVEIAKPYTYRPIYIPVSPPDETTPSDWEIRHSLYDDVVIIPNPEPGTWEVHSMLRYELCEGVDAPEAGNFDVMINSSAETNFQLSVRFLPPIVDNQGAAGDYVPIVATLMDNKGAIPGAIVLGYVEHPAGGADWLVFFDDGLHNDGAAADGVYGNEYRLTWLAGNYNVRLGAFIPDPNEPGQWMLREWNGGFYLTGPGVDPSLDTDQDMLPDAWELRCAPDLVAIDTWGDYDLDALQNIWEFVYGTLPCQADTDHGGEQDGSELLAATPRNPLYAPDDVVRPLGNISVNPLNGMVRIQWTHPLTYTRMIGWIFTGVDPVGRQVDMGNSGVFTDTAVGNDQNYFIRLYGMVDTAVGEYSDPIPFTPKEDPDSPNGYVMINNGAAETMTKQVTLSISASDTPLDGMPSPDIGTGIRLLAQKYNLVSGGIEMRISNDPSFADAEWVPLDTEMPWMLADGPVGIYSVFAQFRDAALNESALAASSILYNPNVRYIPMILK